MHLSHFAVSCGLSFLALTSTMKAQDELPPQPKSGAKVCVATIGNASTSSVLVERLTERLKKGLIQNKINVVSMEITDNG